jgi:hypothetical protein
MKMVDERKYKLSVVTHQGNQNAQYDQKKELITRKAIEAMKYEPERMYAN